jgi:hypothetical protein
MQCKHLQSWIARFIVPAILLSSGTVEIRAQEPGKQLIWPGPEKIGWSREKLAVARTYGNSIHTSAVMIVQGGEVVDQWGDVEKKLTSYSVRKSLISALYGIYSAEGRDRCE